MRLINTSTLQLESFSSSPPPYAVLSHTWDPDGEELSLQEMAATRRSAKTTAKPGFGKIAKTCEIARTVYELKYAWVDTCCIDKTSSAELSEAINSMFKWYRESTICFAYLADTLSLSEPDVLGRRNTFRTASGLEPKWFSRGWTLQELIAPRIVAFFIQDWVHVRYRKDLSRPIVKLTGIPGPILEDNTHLDLDQIPIAKRMSWAAKRVTTREEDLAYCLLGIFDINMPLLYGEGSKAFLRLQEEIIRQCTDMSIFAWINGTTTDGFTGLLARAPRNFAYLTAEGLNLVPNHDILLSRQDFSMTNKGLRFSYPLGLWDMPLPGVSHFLALNHSKYSAQICFRLGVYLQRVGTDHYVRARPGQLAWPNEYASYEPVSNYQVPKVLTSAQMRALWKNTLEIRESGADNLPLHEVYPRETFDATTSKLYAGYTRLFMGYCVFKPLEWKVTHDYFVLVCSFRQETWSFGLVFGKKWPIIQRNFEDRYRGDNSKLVIIDTPQELCVFSGSLSEAENIVHLEQVTPSSGGSAIRLSIRREVPISNVLSLNSVVRLASR